MTSGMKTLRRRELLALAPALTLGPWASPAFAIDLPGVMAQLAQRKSGQARFTEERSVSGFDSPLRSSGTLSFQAPDRFTRQTLEPRAESMEVAGNQLVLQRGGRTRTMALDAIPELAALVDAIRGTLSGDATLLKKHFRIEVSGSDAKWVIALVPLDTRLADQVSGIEIVGQAGDLRSVELRLRGGDRSLMLIEPLKAGPK